MFYTKPPPQPAGSSVLTVPAIFPFLVWFPIGSVVLELEINVQAWTDALATAELG
jgi:uncharacterized membrane protein